MSMRHMLLPLVIACALLGSRSQAADSPLDAIPKSAAAVVRLGGLDPVSARLADFVGQVDAAAGRQVKQLSSFMGVLISNPTLAGTDTEEAWWVAVFARGEDEPAVVFIIPAEDADAMQEAIGQGFEFLPHGNHLIYSEDAEAVAEIRKHLEAKGESVAAAIGDSARAALTESDFALFVNAPAVRAVYKEQLAEAERELDTFFENLPEQTPAPPGVDMQAVFGIYKDLLSGLLRAVKDSNGLTVGVSVTKDAVTVVELVDFQPGSATDRFLQRHKPNELTLLEQLPDGQLGYLAVHADMQGLMQWGMELTARMYQGDAKTKQALQDLMEGFQELEYGAYAMAFGLGDVEGGVLRAQILQEVQPVEKMRELIATSATTMSDIEINGVTQETTLKPNAETYGTRKADVLTVRQEYAEEIDPTGMMQRLVTILYGEAGMTQRMVYMDGLVAQTLGGGREAMQDLLSAVDGDDSGREPIRSVRENLSETANVIGLIDLPRVMTEVLRVVMESGQVPLPFDAEAFGDLDIERSYVGFSVTTEPGALRCRTVVPVEQVQGISEIVQEVQRQINQQAF